jgi:hypothetical protein
LYPTGSTINTTELDTINNILYLGGSFSRLYQHNANYHSIYDVSSSAFQIKSKNYGTNGSIYAYGLDTSNSILYVGGNFTSVTDNNDITIDASYVAAWSIKTQRWTPLGRTKQNGLNGVCNALAVDVKNQIVYVGGNFTTVRDASQFDLSTNYIAKWNVSSGTWSQLGASDVSYNNGLKSMCRSLAYDSKNSQLYVGGDFTQARDSRGFDISANRLAIWTSNNKWSLFGNNSFGSNGTNYVAGTSGRIFSSVYDSCKNVVYVSGDFTYLYDNTNIVLSANYIGYWDITNEKWGRLGTAGSNGLSGSVYGGVFQSSTYGSPIASLAIDSSRQILYVGNLMTSVNDASGTLSNIKYIVSWNINTQRWSRLGGSTTTTNGASGLCSALAYDSRNNRLHVGGEFGTVYDTSNGGQTANKIASWDISNNCWLTIGSGVNSKILSIEMDISNNYLWIAGHFYEGTDSSGVKTLNSCAYWNFNNSRWYPLGTTTYNGYTPNGGSTSNTLKLDSCNNMVYFCNGASLYATGAVTFYDATSTSGLTGNYMGAYNILTSTWELLGNSTYNGLSGNDLNRRFMPSLALDNSNSILYVSGNFISVSDTTNTSQSVNYIAGWNIRTKTWSRLGTSTSNGISNSDNIESNYGSAMTMALDSSCNLYVGSVGANVYDSTGTLSVNGVASWSPSTQKWSRLGVLYSSKGNGVDGSCNALAFDSSNNRVYVGGNFKNANDTSNTDLSVNCVAYWDISNSVWRTLGGTSRTTNGLDGSCNALVFDSSRNRLYVGGNFKKVSDSSKSDQSANYVAFWDASNSLWGQIGGYDASKNGVDASVNALAFDSCKNILYVGGYFLNAYDSSFTLTSPLSTQYLATWNPTTQLWSKIGYSSTSRAVLYGLSNFCRALIYDPSKSSVYVGGDHTSSCDSSNISVDASNIAYINLYTGNIYPLGSTSRNGTNDKVNSMKLDTSNNVVYVDGSFTTVYDSSNTSLSVNYIAKYDVSNSAWSRLGSSTSNGLGGMGKALFYDNSNNAVYASGNFTALRDSTTDSSKNFNYVAKWDVAKSAWSPLGSYGNGTNGFILAYAYDAANYRVFCGGSFTQVFDNSNTRLYANNVAVFNTNTSAWSVLGGNSVTDPSNNGVNSTCRTLVYDQSNTQLYVGGDFTKARDSRGYDLSTNRIAYWDISNSIWKNFGGTTQTTNGLDGSCNAMALDPSNQRLYVGGNFKKVNDSTTIDQSANCVAYWDLTNSLWKQLGGTTRTTNGLDGSCNALVLDPSFTRLYVGGNFRKVNDSAKIDQSANYVAYWDVSNSIWGKLGAANDSSNNGVKNIVRTLAYDNANAKLYVGGDFVEARDSRGKDISLNRVAIWDPSTRYWSGMGSIYSNGTNGYIYGQVFDSSNNVLYVGGTFTEVYDTSNISLSVNYIATWNIGTKTWSRLVDSSANGTNGAVHCIVSNGTKIHIGGGFTEVYDKTNNPLTNTRYMATWDLTTNTWSRMGGSTWETNGMSNAPSSMVIDISNQVLYVACKTSGSNFYLYDSTGSKSVGTIARFNLNSLQWAYLGNSSLNGVGGYYGRVLANSTLSLTFDSSSSSVYCVSYANDAFYYVRDDRGIDISINSVARWDVRLEKWFGLGGHSSNGTNGQINAYAYDGSRNRMYVGGGFTKVYDLSQIWLDVSNVAAWDVAGKYWVRLGGSRSSNGVDASVNALAIDSSYSRLYVGGNFKKMSDSSKVDQSANYVVYWDISNSLWGQMGGSTTTTNGLDGSCNALAIDNSNGRVYVGGKFRNVSDSTTLNQSANYVAYWNISDNTWSRLGATDVSYNNGLNLECRSLIYDPSKTQLYVGGDFTAVRDSRNSDILANRIAIWKPSTAQWSVMGTTSNNGLDGSCNALALDSSNNRLYVGGNFKKVSDASQSDQSANYIAYWDLSNSLWFKLGGTDISKNGLDGSCNALIYDNSNNRLYVGGSFKKVSDSSQIDQSANYVAYWDVSNSIWKQLGGTTRTRNGASDIVNALAVDVSKNVFAGGRFISVNDSAYNTYLANYTAFWSPSTQRWSRLGSIVKNGLYSSSNGASTSYTTTIDTSNSVLYGPYSVYYGYFDVSNTSGLTTKSLCAWDINNECWITLTENKATTINEPVFMKYDKVKQRVYMAITNYSTPPIIPDASNGSLYVNGVVYYDVITKRFYPLGGGANNNYATLTNGLFHYTNGAFATVTFTRDSYFGNDSTLSIDNSGNLFINSSTTYTGAAYNVAGSNNKIISYRSIVMFDVSNNEWNVLGSNVQNGVDASCISMVYDNSNQELYVSGNFANTTDTLNDYLPRNFKSPISKVAKWSVKNSRWSNLAGQRFDASNGTNGAIYASVYDSCKNIIYMGGNFTIVSDTSNGDLSANYIAAWDVSGQYWFRIGTAGNNGLNGICNALAIDSSKQILYVGGGFRNVFDGTYLDQSANYVASWNISSQKWSILGASETVNGVDGSCNALALDSSNSRLYVGGHFLNVSDSSKADQSANYVAYWDISNSLWKKLGANDDSSNNGVKSVCRTLAYDQSNTQLYVGGDFLYVRDSRGFDISANRIAIWKPSTTKWSLMGDLGQNGTNGEIFAYVYDSCKNVMYVGGNFTTVYDSSNIFGLSANCIAKWNIATSLWSRLTDSSWNGVDASCNALAMDTSNQILYAGGNFTTVYDSTNTNTLTNTQRIAAWNVNTSTWSRLGSTTATTNGLTSTSARCNAMVYDSSNSRLYVGGNFTTLGDASYADFSANHVAYWNISTSRWSKLGASDVSYNNGLKTMCRSLAYDSKNSQLYVGGDFTQVRDSRGIDLSINRIARWNESNSLWTGMGNIGSNGYKSNESGGGGMSSVYDSCKNVIYIVGYFSYVYDNSNIALNVNNIAAWNINSQCWSRLGTSTSNGISSTPSFAHRQCLSMDSSNQILYVGSNFTSVYDASGTLSNVNRIAAWDVNTERWYRLGGSTTLNNGVNSAVHSLVYDSRNLKLHVGWENTSAYDTTNATYSANYIASWNITTSVWERFGTSVNNGTNSTVAHMALDISNNYLWVMGFFTTVKDASGSLTVKNCAYWNFNNSRWYPLGTTTYNGFGNTTQLDGGIVSQLDTSNNMLYICCGNTNSGGIYCYDATYTTTPLYACNIVAYNILTSRWTLLGTNPSNNTSSTTNGVGVHSSNFNSRPSMALDTSNSILYVQGLFTSVGDATNGRQSVNYMAAWNIRTQTWSRMGSSTSNGITNPYASAYSFILDGSKNLFALLSADYGNGKYVYDSSGTLAINYGAIWKPTTERWYRIGTNCENGLDGSCNALAFDSSNNRLYVGGNFKNANDSLNTDLSTNCVAYWDISNSVWKTLGGTTRTTNGLDGSCNALVLDSVKNRLYVGGNFKKVSDSSKSDQSANYVVYWDVLNSLWGQMGGSTSTTTGVDGSVNALAFDSNRNLFVGGVFANARSTSGDISANKAIIWSTSNKWTTLGVGLYQNGVTDGSVNALALDETNQRLYVGGSFSKVKDSSNAAITTNKIAYWDLNTNTWNALGTTDISKNGVNAICRTLNYNSSKTTLYAGGDFTRVSDSTGYDLSANRIASWNQSTGIWTPFGSAYRNANNGLNNSVYTISTAKNNQVFVGGTFTGGNDISGSITSNYGLIWNPSSYKWSKFGGYSGIRMDGSVNAVAIDSSYTKLFLGGTFSRMSDNCGNSYTVNDGAIWNINSQTLSAMGSFNLNGLNFYPNVFAMDTINNVLYMGGNFTTAYDDANSSSSIFAMYVIGYDITNNKWIQLGNEAFNGVTGEVTGLSIDTTNSILYVSGNYTRMFDGTNGLQSVNYIAAYNINSKTWGRLGSSTYNGTSIAPNSIAFNSSNSKLYVGGNFTSVYDSSNSTLTVKYIAAWDTTNSAWSRLGANTTYNGVDASINILQYNSSSNYLLTVGNFSNINDSVNTKIRQIPNYATYKF